MALFQVKVKCNYDVQVSDPVARKSFHLEAKKITKMRTSLALGLILVRHNCTLL